MPHRPTWRGLNVVAIDGDQYQLPAAGDALECGFVGYPVSGNRETYYPRMYVSVCYDVLSGTVVDFTHSNKNNELERALEMVSSATKEMLYLYDRLYFCTDLVAAHGTNGSYFVCRLKTGARCLSVIQEFVESGKRNQTVSIEGYDVHLLKLKNPRSGEYIYFATNLPRDRFRNKEIAELYLRRWDIETSFRDLTKTMNLEDWHTQYVNGILQEVYVALWIFNQIKQIEFFESPRKWYKKLGRNYRRPCFKSTLNWLTRWFTHLYLNVVATAACIDELSQIIKTTMERRTRLSRSFDRVSKQPAVLHSSVALVERRA